MKKLLLFLSLFALAAVARGAESAPPPEVAQEEASAITAGEKYKAKVHATIDALKAQVEDQSLLVAELEALRQQVVTLQAQVLQLQQERDAALAAKVAAEAETKALREQLAKMRDEIDHILTLAWDYDSDRASGFVVERAIGQGDFAQLVMVDAQTRSIDDNVQPRYRVAAFNAGGLSAWSPIVVRE